MSVLDTLQKLITVDKKGYLNIWEYEKHYFKSEIGGFEPYSKNKISLNVYSFIEGDKAPKTLFPDKNTQNVEQKQLEMFRTIYLDDQFKEKVLSEKKTDNKVDVWMSENVIENKDLHAD